MRSYVRFLEGLGDAAPSRMVSRNFRLECLRHLMNLRLILIIPVLETLRGVVDLGCLSIRWHGQVLESLR